MRELLGFWIISLAVIFAITEVTGYNLLTKDKIAIIVGFQAFIGLLEIGVYIIQ